MSRVCGEDYSLAEVTFNGSKRQRLKAANQLRPYFDALAFLWRL